MTLLWFVIWLISNVVGDTSRSTFDPRELVDQTLIRDRPRLSRQHAPQLGAATGRMS